MTRSLTFMTVSTTGLLQSTSGPPPTLTVLYLCFARALTTADKQSFNFCEILRCNTTEQHAAGYVIQED